MNPKSFLGLMSDISDEYIASAANPHSKSIRWYQVSAIAACIVLLTAIAIYPKLRMQMPEVTEPPAVVTESTAPVTFPAEPAVTTGTAAVSATARTTKAKTVLTQTTAAVTVYTTAVTEHAKTDAPSVETAASKTTALQERTETNQSEAFTDASQAVTKTSEITEAIQTVTTASAPNFNRVPISIKKGQTSNFPLRPGGSSPPTGTDAPGNSNQTKLKTETVKNEKYLKFTMPIPCQDAVLLSIEYDGFWIEAKFLCLPYFESPSNPKTVYYEITLPDEFDEMLFSARGEAVETIDPAAFSEAAANEPDYITILEQEESL